MKFSALMLSWLSGPLRERNLRPFIALIGLFVALVGLYSAIFHLLMAREGEEYSWATSVYWTVVTMSTLGYGDVVFTSGVGQLFSVLVLLSGSTLILVLLPFTFIQFVFMPWMDRRERRRTPRRLPEDSSGHLVLTRLGAIEEALVRRCRRAAMPYVVLIDDPVAAGALSDQGYRVMVGDLDDPATYDAARIAGAAALLTTHDDAANANITFTARERTASPIVATATADDALDVLELAGATEVLRLGHMLGQDFAERVLAPDGTAHIIERRGDLCIAEAGAASSKLAGRNLADAAVRTHTGCNVVGAWTRGVFTSATATTVIDPAATLVLAGTAEQLDAYNKLYASGTGAPEWVMVLGGGRVGTALSAELHAAGVGHSLVDRNITLHPYHGGPRLVEGDAADLGVLEEAGLREASTVVVTTHDDDVNVYLTLYIRRLRPNVEVLARSNQDRNVATLYRAGADSVLSYASAGADAVWNIVRGDDATLLAEGLEMFRVHTPANLAGKSLAEADVARRTGCTVVAVVEATGNVVASPGADFVLPADGALLLIGSSDAATAGAALARPRATARQS